MDSLFQSLLLHLAVIAFLVFCAEKRTLHPGSFLWVSLDPAPFSESASLPPHARATRPIRASQASLSTSSSSGSSSGSPSESSSGSSGSQSAARSFWEELYSSIEQQKEYPMLARERHETGRVKVAFTLKKDGQIVSIRCLEASTYPLLNQAALDTVRRLGRFRPVPDALSSGDLNVVVPIEFRTQ